MASKSFPAIYGSSRVYPYIPAYFFRSNESPVRPPIGNNPAQSKRLLRDLFLEYFDEPGSDRLPVAGILADQRLENVAEKVVPTLRLGLLAHGTRGRFRDISGYIGVYQLIPAYFFSVASVICFGRCFAFQV